MANNIMTPAQVADIAINDERFDSNLIKEGYIEAAQLGNIKPLLGTDFFDDVIASPGTYTDLLVYIKNCLAFYTLVIALPFIHVHLVSQGIQVNFTDYGQAATDRQRSDLAEASKIMADIYQTELIRYLTDNITTYSDWDKTTNYVKRGGLILY